MSRSIAFIFSTRPPFPFVREFATEYAKSDFEWQKFVSHSEKSSAFSARQDLSRDSGAGR
jgi:hypothetical protein